MTTVEILRAAKARIDTPGKWSQRVELGNWTNGGSCAVLAVTRTFGENPAYRDYSPAVGALARVVGAHSMCGVFDWNDAPERTHAEVMAAFDRAIRNEEARAQEFEVAPVFEVAR